MRNEAGLKRRNPAGKLDQLVYRTDWHLGVGIGITGIEMNDNQIGRKRLNMGSDGIVIRIFLPGMNPDLRFPLHNMSHRFQHVAGLPYDFNLRMLLQETADKLLVKGLLNRQQNTCTIHRSIR
jgi:hypothetical protein